MMYRWNPDSQCWGRADTSSALPSELVNAASRVANLCMAPAIGAPTLGSSWADSAEWLSQKAAKLRCEANAACAGVTCLQGAGADACGLPLSTTLLRGRNDNGAGKPRAVWDRGLACRQ